MKKFFVKIFVLFFICTIFLTNNRTVHASDFPYLEAQGVVLMDGITGEILYSNNSNVQFEPASTTKVMTALVVLNNSNLNDKVTIGLNPTLVDGSAIGIREGEVYTVKELLLGLLLESGNDCAEALAEYISGSNAEFGKLMTEEARRLGAMNTTFKNPSGLSEEGHLTTAYDLALIMREAANNPEFVEISRTESYYYENHPFSDGTEKWATNRNNCYVDWSPYYYENLYCGKTGWTPEANHTYTAAAKQNDQMLIASFLNAYDKAAQYTSVGQLFDWGFANFTTKKIISEGDILDEIILDEEITLPLLATKDIYYTFNNSEYNQSLNLNKSVSFEEKDLSKTTLNRGDILFNASLLINGKSYESIELASGIDRIYKEVKPIDKTSKSFFKTIFIIILIILILFIILIIRIRYVAKRRRFRKKRKLIRKKHFNHY